MKFVEILEKKNTLLEVMNLTLPRKATVAIARNVEKIEKEIELYNAQRTDIANRYAKKDEMGNFVLDGNNYTFADEDSRNAFIEEVTDLNDTDIDIDIVKFNASELDKCDESDRYNLITPAQEIALGWMINYDEG